VLQDGGMVLDILTRWDFSLGLFWSVGFTHRLLPLPPTGAVGAPQTSVPQSAVSPPTALAPT
jgi:hypothetical protein